MSTCIKQHPNYVDLLFVNFLGCFFVGGVRLWEVLTLLCKRYSTGLTPNISPNGNTKYMAINFH